MAVEDGDILSGVLDRFRELVRNGLADGSLTIGQSLDIKSLMLTKNIKVSDVDEARIMTNLTGYISTVAGGEYPHLFKYVLSDGSDLMIVAVTDDY